MLAFIGEHYIIAPIMLVLAAMAACTLAEQARLALREWYGHRETKARIKGEHERKQEMVAHWISELRLTDQRIRNPNLSMEQYDSLHAERERWQEQLDRMWSGLPPLIPLEGAVTIEAPSPEIQEAVARNLREWQRSAPELHSETSVDTVRHDPYNDPEMAAALAPLFDPVQPVAGASIAHAGDHHQPRRRSIRLS